MSLFSRKEKKESLDSGLNKTKESLFAKISRYDYNGTAFYIMPRIHGVGKTDWDADEYLTEDENDWVYEHVCDLHNGNYGWKDGHVVIFDYAARY
jgi:hypothetical protein